MTVRPLHQSLPRSSGAGLTPLLDEGEATLAVLETDLDASLHFDDGIVILTPRGCSPARPAKEGTGNNGRSRPGCN